MKKTVPVEQAVGMVLPHDITEIVREKSKQSAFSKGHIIQQEDVEHLLRLGKDNIYVLDLSPTEIHENEAALLLASALSGSGTTFSPQVKEGKVSIIADHDGLLKVDAERLLAMNMLGEVSCSTLHSNTLVKKGQQVAGTRMIPLIGQRSMIKQAVQRAETACSDGVLQVLPLRAAKVGLVITGNEVFYGRIEDQFENVLRQKMQTLGSEVVQVGFAPDDPEKIATEIHACLDAGADCIVTSGGMSVDPDDVTRAGIVAAGAKSSVYGTPVLPGAMLLVGKIGEVPVIGVPACGMYFKITVLDLILPRILVGEDIGRPELAALGHGGLCRGCATCTYPHCSFGK